MFSGHLHLAIGDFKWADAVTVHAGRVCTITYNCTTALSKREYSCYPKKRFTQHRHGMYHTELGGFMKPQTNRQRQAIATKHKIFSCAVSLFAEKSYENVTVQDICDKAEVSVGAFYHHFKSKENILDEGYRLFDQQSEEAWKNGHPDSPLEAIHFLISGQARSMEDMGAMAALQYFKHQLSSKEKYILNKDRFFYQTIYHAVLEETFAGTLLGDPAAITEDILGITRGMIYDWCLHEGGYALSERTNHTLDMILSYYQKQGTN